ncbi:SPX domain-containing protein [Dichotomocladium elegans]|nr:SPX domain-containing protein [Dichotomocladium elegans]
MKFAKQIEHASLDLPEDWRPHLIHYKMLKKSIRPVVDELQTQGLLNQGMVFAYQFDGDAHNPQPCIQLSLDEAARLNLHHATDTPTETTTIKIRLLKDSEFFHLLIQGIAQAALLYTAEQKRFFGDVKELGAQLANVSSPQKQKEMYTWREILKVYMDASVFEITKTEYNAQSFERSKQHLTWFKDELQRIGLARKLGSKRSRQVLKRFIDLNAQLVDFKWLYALNHMAIVKILKKHDKRSGLTAKTEFPAFAKANAVIVENVLSSLYSALISQLVSVVPQLDNHSCPICYSIAWRPIRLECSHVFCVRCLIKAHKKKLFDCPICRHKNAVGNADSDNLDKGLQNFMLLYFPREIKEKRRENEKEQAMIDMEAINRRAWTRYSNNQKELCVIM